jgi:hypothetical protein
LADRPAESFSFPEAEDKSATPEPQLVCVDPAMAGRFWPHVAPLVARALAATATPIDGVAADVLRGDALIWLAWSDVRGIEAVAVTQVVEIAGERVCMIVSATAVAPRARWLGLLAPLEHYAAAEGCAAIRLRGRKGWQRLLPDYAAPYIVLEKRL